MGIRLGSGIAAKEGSAIQPGVGDPDLVRNAFGWHGVVEKFGGEGGSEPRVGKRNRVFELPSGY